MQFAHGQGHAASYMTQLTPGLEVKHLHLANLTHKRITSYDYCMHYPAINLANLVVLVSAGASPCCMPKQGSQGGVAVCVAENQIVAPESPQPCRCTRQPPIDATLPILQAR